MIKFFTICLLILPWIIIPSDKVSDPFRLPKATFFDFICMGIICFSFYSGVRKRYFNKYLSWFTIWLFVIFAINWYLPFTLSFNNRQLVNMWILEPMIHLILALWVSYIVLAYFEKNDYEKIAKTICFSSVIISSVGILQVLGLDIFGKIAIYNHPSHLCAFLDNPNIVGNYLALSLPFFLFIKNKKYVFGLIISLTGIILSKSELSLACGIIGLLVYLILILRKKTKVILAIFLISIVVIVIILSKLQLLISKYGAGRIEIWKEAFTKFKDNPIFGQGIGIYKTWEIEYLGAKSLVLHNDWFEIAIQVGVVGLILLILIVINSLRKFNYKQDDYMGFAYYSSFISFLVLMFGSFPLEIAPLALFGLINWWAVETL